METVQNDPTIQRLQNRLNNLLEEHGPLFWKAVFGLADPHFGHCECGRLPVCRNVERNHFMCCDHCKTAWYVGSNLFSAWRDESPKSWRANRQLLETSYRRIEPTYPFILFGDNRLATADEINSSLERHVRDRAAIDDCSSIDLLVRT
jgi:hypothetical protein